MEFRAFSGEADTGSPQNMRPNKESDSDRSHPWRESPASDPESLPHRHDDLPDDHPHLGGEAHTHPFVIDDLHTRWPGR